MSNPKAPMWWRIAERIFRYGPSRWLNRVFDCVEALDGSDWNEIDLIRSYKRQCVAGRTGMDWLSHPVSVDGNGYRLQSPAGGWVHITNDERQRIVACVNLCAGLTDREIELLSAADLPRKMASVAGASLGDYLRDCLNHAGE